MALRIIRPALEQVSLVTTGLRDLETQSGKHAEMLATIEGINSEIRRLKDADNGFEQQMGHLVGRADHFEKQTMEELDSLRKTVKVQEMMTEEFKIEVGKLSREAPRLWEEIRQMETLTETSFNKVWEDVAGCHKHAVEVRTELLEQVQVLHRLREEMIEDLWGPDKGLMKLGRDVSSLKTFVMPLPQIESQVSKIVIDVENSLQRQAEVEELVSRNTETLAQTANILRDGLTTVKVELTHDINLLIAKHHAVIKDMRSDFREELSAIHKTREETLRYTSESDKFIQALNEDIKSYSKRLDALHRELVNEIQDLQQTKSKDRVRIAQEFSELRKELTEEREHHKQTRSNLEFLSRIFGLALEGTRMASALQAQDFADRLGERWLCSPSDAWRMAEPAQQIEALEKQRGHATNHRANEEPVMLDLKKPVPVGKYLPGQVSWGEGIYDRRDLLVLNHRLLQKAHHAFVNGPKQDWAPQRRQSAAAGMPALGPLLAAADLMSARSAGSTMDSKDGWDRDGWHALKPSEARIPRSARRLMQSGGVNPLGSGFK